MWRLAVCCSGCRLISDYNSHIFTVWTNTHVRFSESDYHSQSFLSEKLDDTHYSTLQVALESKTFEPHMHRFSSTSRIEKNQIFFANTIWDCWWKCEIYIHVHCKIYIHVHCEIYIHVHCEIHIHVHCEICQWQVTSQYVMKCTMCSNYDIATRCSTIQQPTAHCYALLRTATHCNALQCTATYCTAMQQTHKQSLRWIFLYIYIYIYIHMYIYM